MFTLRKALLSQVLRCRNALIFWDGEHNFELMTENAHLAIGVAGRRFPRPDL